MWFLVSGGENTLNGCFYCLGITAREGLTFRLNNFSLIYFVFYVFSGELITTLFVILF